MEQLEREILAGWASTTPTATAEQAAGAETAGRSHPAALNCGSKRPRPPGQHADTMSEDDSSTQHAEPHEKRRSWLDRISSALSGEPSTREDLVEILRDAQADGLIAADTLTMMEGAIAVSDLTVGDVMVPRSQMVAAAGRCAVPGPDAAAWSSPATRAFPCTARTRTRSWASCWPRTCCAAWSPTTARPASTSCCARRC